MKTNYQSMLDEIIFNIVESNSRPKLLLHSCCAPCSSYVLEYLTKYFDITIFYYNPNIYPYDEYKKRFNEQIKLINDMNPENMISIIDCDYNNNLYEEAIKGFESEPEGGKRCHICYELRLEQTAKQAKNLDFDYFGTTLSVSPYKNSEKLNLIGKSLEEQYNVNYLYSDFKKKDGYKRSIVLSREYNLYRQEYCGCKYSKIVKEKELIAEQENC